MQSVNIPSKYLVPFATNDSAKVEIPVTTATVGRASQSLGFPPITGQPPETGGLPPQLEDFNGAVNQIARVAWWSMLGGQWRYDSAFAIDTNIGGYPAGAELQSVADSRITWLSLVDNNVADPDGIGTGWAPLVSYAPATITTAGGTTTPTLPVAAHATLVVSGTLSSSAIIVLPTWTREWTVTNSTTGAFTVTVKTASGSGVVIPQNGAPTRVNGDGTNITQLAANIAAATTGTQAMQLAQGFGRLINVQKFTANGTYTPTAGTGSIIIVGNGGGGGGGGAPATAAGQRAVAHGGQCGGYAVARYTSGFTGGLAVVVGIGGAGGAAGQNVGIAGGATTLGSILSIPGGSGGNSDTASTSVPTLFTSTVTSVDPTVTGGVLLQSCQPVSGTGPFALTLTQTMSGCGGDSMFGRGGRSNTNGAGLGAIGSGSGGSGAAQQSGFSGQAGGSGAGGILLIYEYA